MIFAKGAAHANIVRLYKLKRKATLLKHAASPLMEVAMKLASGRGPSICANSRHYFPRRLRPSGTNQRLNR